MGRQQLLHDRRDRRRIADHPEAPGLHDRLGGAALLQQFRQDLLGDLAADRAALDQAHHLGQLLRPQGQGGIGEALGIHMGGDVAGDPVGHRLRIDTGGHGGLEVFRHRPLIGEHAGVVDRKAQLVGIAVALGGGQLRQLSEPGLALLGAHLNGPEIRIGEIAVIAGALLTAHTLGELLALIPEAGFLQHRLTGLIGLDLALDFILTGPLNRREGIHVLDLHLCAKGCIRPPPHGDVHIAAQRAFLHVAVAHPQVAHDAANLRGILRRLTAGAQIRLAHDLGQGHASAVVIHQRMGGAGQAIAAGMHQLAGILLHMEPLDADGFEIGFLALFGHLNFDPAFFGNGFVVLGNLIVFGEIGIEILLAIEFTVRGDLEVQS